MSSIDERVVQMKFDNAQFQKGVSDTRSSLDKLKQGLNLDGSTKSLEGLDAAGKKFSLAKIAEGVTDLGSKFTALSVIGITALTNIANKAVNAGLAFANSFTMAPVMDGFREYEQKMGSIQTILANTAKDGTSLKDVSASLEELNKYADKTIYNFGDMTRNIGLFTNAGIKLEDATAMIKGFSNEAAMSGTTAASAAGAAYQLSQALSKGKITLEDWRSLTNAGMGNKNMQTGIIDIAKAMGTFEGKGIDANAAAKDFNGTLEKGWLTADVMQNYLKIQAGELSDEQMKNLGLNQQQIEHFQKMQVIAEEAATKVRTWTQLIDTLKEAVGSSWATTAELLLGDFDEATVLFTSISDTLGPMIGKMGDARNNLIKGWADGGGRAKLIEGLSSVFQSLIAVMGVVGKAWSEIFPPVTVDTLMGITDALVSFLKSLTPSATTLANLQRVFKGLFAVLDIGWITIQRLWGIFTRLVGGFSGAGGGILELAANFGDFLVKIRDVYKDSEKIGAFFVGLTPILKAPGEVINWLVQMVVKLVNALKKLDFSGFQPDLSGFRGALDQVNKSMGNLRPTGETIGKVWDWVIGIFKKALEFGEKLGEKLAETFGGIGKGMEGAAKGIDFHVIFGALGVGALGGIFITIKKFLGNVMGAIEDFGEGGGPIQAIKDAFGALTDTLGAMQSTLKASTLILIAGAIALLTLSVVQLSKVDQSKLAGALATMTVMFIQLSVAMAVLDKVNPLSSIGTLIGMGTAMVILAVAIRVLVESVEALSKLSWEELAKGLTGVSVLLLGIAVAAKIMSTQNSNLITTGIGLMAVAVAIKILASAVKDFSELETDKMVQGLIGVATTLVALAIFTKIVSVNKGAIGSAVGLILLGVALKVMASAVSDFGNMDINKIQQGLGALTAVLIALAAFSRAVNPSGMISMGVAMVILGGAMKIMASALADLGSIPWDVLGRGMVGLAGALVIIAAATQMMPKDMIAKAAALVIIGAALQILADVLSKMGGMSVETIAIALSTLALSLIILAAALNVMTGAVAGAAALIIAAGALRILADVLVILGGMDIMSIGIALATIAATLTLLGLAGLVLAPVVPALMGLGVAVMLLGVGAALAGVGLLAFSVGLTALAAAGGAAVTVLIASVTALLGLIPYALTQVGQGIVNLAKVLGDNVSVFVTLGINLLTGLLDGLMVVLPKILNFVVELVLKLLEIIASNIGRFVDVGMRIIVGFLQGIAGQIGNVVSSAIDILVAFLTAIGNNLGRVVDAGGNIVIQFIQGIGRNMGRIASAGYDTVIEFVNSLANTIRNNQARMESAGNNLGDAIINGMTAGVRNGIGRVADAARNIATSALDTVRSWLGIKSPSREFKKLGKFSSEGMAIGISDYGYLVDRASKGVGQTALDAMRATMQRVGNGLDGNMDITPTIRPVLDLTRVQQESGRIANMLTLPPLDIIGTYQTAAAVVASQREQARIDDENNGGAGGDDPGTTGGVIYNQYNYSPVALSRAEIYRGTKNQLSEFNTQKGVMADRVG